MAHSKKLLGPKIEMEAGDESSGVRSVHHFRVVPRCICGHVCGACANFESQ